MSYPGYDGDFVVFAIPEPLESHVSEAALTVGLCADYLRLYLTEAPPSDSALRLLAGTLPDGDAGTAAALLVGMLDSLAFNRAGITNCIKLAKRSGTDVRLTLDRLQQTAATPRFDIARRQCQLDALPWAPSLRAAGRMA